MSKRSKHVWIVDVIEDGSASIEVDGRTVTPIPEWMLPEGAKEGDVLSVTHDRTEGKSALLIENDPEAKEKALNRSEKQVSRKSKNDRGGDIQLQARLPHSRPASGLSGDPVAWPVQIHSAPLRSDCESSSGGTRRTDRDRPVQVGSVPG